MHVKLINKNLYFGKYKVKCAIGKRGITSKKSEGDKKTPTGRLKFVSMFYRKDRIKKIRAKIKKKSIKKNMGWCNDYRSKYYNKLIQFPFKYSAEKLFLKKNIYNIILVLDFISFREIAIQPFVGEYFLFEICINIALPFFLITGFILKSKTKIIL